MLANNNLTKKRYGASKSNVGAKKDKYKRF